MWDDTFPDNIWIRRTAVTVFLVLSVLVFWGMLDLKVKTEQWEASVAAQQAIFVNQGDSFRALVPSYFDCRSNHPREDKWISGCLSEMWEMAEKIQMQAEFPQIRDEILKIEPIAPDVPSPD